MNYRSLLLAIPAVVFVCNVFAASPEVVIQSAFLPAASSGPKLDVDVDPAAPMLLAQKPKAVRLTDVPLVNSGKGQFVLEPFDVLATGATISARNGTDEIPLSMPDVVAYKGSDLTDPSRKVFMTVTDGTEVRMMVTSPHEEASFLNPVKDEKGNVSHKLSKADPDALVGFVCGNERFAKLTQPMLQATRSAVTQALTNQMLEVEVLYDVDYRLFTQAFGSNSAAATNYATNLIAAASAIYQRDLNVSIKIKHLVIWTTPDPFDAGSADEQLTKYQNFNASSQDRQSLQRDAAQLLAYRSYGGIAYVGALCGTSYSYSVANIDADAVFPIGAYHWDLFVVTHELGHNFNSVHTHCYTPPIDCCYTSECNCGPATNVIGTIMSYCHLRPAGVNLVFHERTKTVMRSYAEGSACLSPSVPSADIEVTGRNSVIPDGSASTSVSDGTYIADVSVNGGAVTQSFTINNRGDAALNLANPPVVITGDTGGDFSVVQQPATVIQPGSATTFQITFDPVSDGLKRATIVISSDDPDEPSYDFAVAGTGGITVPSADVSVSQVVPSTSLSNAPINAVVTVINNGWAVADAVIATVDFPDQVTILGATSSMGTPVVANGLVTISLGSLGVAQQAVITVTFSAADPGSYWSSASVASSTGDPTSSNNSVSGTVAVSDPDGIDLKTWWNGATPVLRASSKGNVWSISGSVTVNNRGNQKGAKTKLGLYLSNDAVFDPTDTLIKTTKTKALQPGESTVKSFTAKLPVNVDPTGRFVFGVADATGKVGEYNEGNNGAASS